MQLSWHPVSVLWGTIVLLVLAAALVLAWLRTRRAGIGPSTRALIALRFVAAITMAGFLFRPCLHINVPGRMPFDLLVLWDRSESMHLVVSPDDSVTRLDAAVHWWEQVRSELERVHGLRVRHAAFAESLTAPTAPVELPMSPPGKATDIRVALEQADRMIQAEGRVLLVTDGCHNTGPSPLEVARLARVPVDVIVPWEVGHEADLRIDDLVGRRVVPPGDTVVVRALLRWEALAQPDSVNVILEREGVPVDSLAFVAGAGWGERDVLLASPMPVQGVSVLRVTALGAPESVPGNNTRSLSVEVASKTRRVALLASAPHPDYGALRRLLQRDASVSLGSGVLEDDGSLAGGGAPTELLRAADVIIVVSSSTNPLPPGLCAQIAVWVQSGAKGLLWIGVALPSCPSLAALLPGGAPGENRDLRAVRPGSETSVHPVLSTASVDWERMPPLVINTSALAPPGSYVPLVDQKDELPVLALTSGVTGHIAWMNTHTLWRWLLGDGAGVAYSGALVERLLAWLGQQGGPVRLQLSQVSDVLVAEVQVYDLDWRPWDGCSLTFALSDSTGHPIANLAIGAVAGAAGFYRGRTGPLPYGRHRYTLTVRSGQDTVVRKDGWVDVQPAAAELTDAVPCAGVLRGIARASGGRYYGVGDAAEWVSTLSRRGTRTISVCPWHGGWWALVALVLLSAEWYMRRRIGLS